MVQALSPDRAEQPLRVSILPGRSRRRRSVANAHGRKTSCYGMTIRGVSVADQIAGSMLPRKGLSDLSGDPVGLVVAISCMTGTRSSPGRSGPSLPQAKLNRWCCLGQHLQQATQPIHGLSPLHETNEHRAERSGHKQSGLLSPTWRHPRCPTSDTSSIVVSRIATRIRRITLAVASLYARAAVSLPNSADAWPS